MYWYSPFPQSTELKQSLENAGIFFCESIDELGTNQTLLIYDSPDQILNASLEDNSLSELSINTIISGYDLLLKAFQSNKGILVSSWNLSRIDSISEEYLFQTDYTEQQPFLPIVSNNLLCNIILESIESNSNLLDYYLDIELKSKLINRKLDTDYFNRIKCSCIENNSLIHEFYMLIHEHKIDKFNYNMEFSKLNKHNHELRNKLSNSIDMIEELNQKLEFTTQNQLEQTKAFNIEKLEYKNENQKLIDNNIKLKLEIDLALSQLKNILYLKNDIDKKTIETDELIKRISSLDETNLKQSKETLKLTSDLEHSHQELEKYFLRSRQLEDLNKAHQFQLVRAFKNIGRLFQINPEIFDNTDINETQVEVLPPIYSSLDPNNVQVKALLNSYSSALSRMFRLLKSNKYH